MELNYENEAANQMYFRKELHDRFNSGGDRFSLNFLRNSNKRVEQVIVPKVHEQYTTQRVLISEWIDGTPLAQAPPEEIRQLIPTGVALFLCQLLDIGRFHADPHPVGCIFVICCFRTVCTMAQLVRSLLPHQRETYT
jgi:predicted unusual protein kinase regulating ubiquinone biosynthesis (AarF/ABC1/UbiB family)